jgi:hypothetical protein
LAALYGVFPRHFLLEVISRHIFGTSTINLALHRMIMALLGMA